MGSGYTPCAYCDHVMMFREIFFNSEDYKKSLALRERILRSPLGLKLSSQDTSEEDKQYHFGIFDKSDLVACVVVTPLDRTSVKLRQMAVSTVCQGRNIGKHLIQSTEEDLSKRGYITIEMSARQTAIGFYKKLDYVTDGDEFIVMGIAHIKMRKSIQ